MGGGKFVEGGVRTIFSGLVLDDVASAHVLEHLIRVPGTLYDEVTIVLEPSDQSLGFFADIFADPFSDGLVFGGGDDFQSFDSHEGNPCV